MVGRGIKKKAQGLLVTEVFPGGLAARAGIDRGHRLLEINGYPLHDQIDYRFHQTGERVSLRVAEPSGRQWVAVIQKAWDEDLGLILEPDRPRVCNNKCIFCFVHQLPRGLRKGLYFKDEDYRLSFLHGNYLSLTNLSSVDLARIIALHLSPLYISVHSTDHTLRNFLLGNPRAPDIMEVIKALAQARIEMHAQVVLCPGINDGPHLWKTISDLRRLYPAVASVAVVPVGLTRFRRGLFPLTPVTPSYAARLVRTVRPKQVAFRRELGRSFLYLADEFYILAGLRLPGKAHYDGFYQVENGVGLSRLFLSQFMAISPRLPKGLPRLRRVSVVTGEMAAGLLLDVVRRLQGIRNLEIQLHRVQNRFFGRSITVAGLLTGSDVLISLKGKRLGEEVLLPSVAFKADEDVFLDDMRLTDLEVALGVPTKRVEASASILVEAIVRNQEIC